MASERRFESGCDMLEVTSLHRPNLSWHLIDDEGHGHRWLPAGNYNPTIKYEVPSLVWVKDGEEYWEDDDEPHDVGHHECRLCGQRIEPGYCPDSSEQYISGLRWYRVDGRSVSREEFVWQARLAYPDAKIDD